MKSNKVKPKKTCRYKFEDNDDNQTKAEGFDIPEEEYFVNFEENENSYNLT